MLDERALVSRLEAADTEELGRIFLQASVPEEKVLRTYLGDDRFRCMRNLALRRRLGRSECGGKPKGNVVIIPGLLGSELTSKDRTGTRERVWLDPRNIVGGGLDRLRLDANGLSELDPQFKIETTGVLKRYYGQLILSLAGNWNVHAFAYDWRKDFRLAAAQLQACINTWFPENEAVNIVAHAEGGLVARAYIADYSSRWKNSGGRLIMLGTPNYGTFEAPQAITGHLEMIRQIELLNSRHEGADFRTVVKSFPSIYQILPSSELTTPKNLSMLYEPETYGAQTEVAVQHLVNAKNFFAHLKEHLHEQLDTERMVYVAGHGQRTCILKDVSKIHSFDPELPLNDEKHDAKYLSSVYGSSCNGDGKVPHRLGVLRDGGKRIPAFYIEGPGSALCTNSQALVAIEEMLDDTQDLSAPEFHRRLTRISGLKPLTDEMLEDAPYTDEKKPTQCGKRDRIKSLVRSINVRGSEPADCDFITVEEREIDELVTRGFMGFADANGASDVAASMSPPEIKINIVLGDITDTKLRRTDKPNIEINADAIGLGHYSGNKPHGILAVLDRRISLHLSGEPFPDDEDASPPDQKELDAIRNRQGGRKLGEADLLLTQFTQRGTLRGELAEPFLLPDPRDPDRIIAVAGMGEPGRFGVPELTLLARELCWSLGRLRYEHLATVLIGNGRGNLSVANAVCGWIHGIKLAITGANSSISTSTSNTGRSLKEVTFFLHDPRKLLETDEAIKAEADSLLASNRMIIEYHPLNKRQKSRYRKAAVEFARRRLEKELERGDSPAIDQAPTRITVGVQGNEYRFGAITNRASVPERLIPLDPGLVSRANDELAAASTVERQLELGRFMERLLFPEDLRSLLSGNAPLVMMLDSTTARIHWELLAQSELVSASQKDHSDQNKSSDQDDGRFSFLGTSRGFTRQLRTVLAPPPPPPPPERRMLRVLIVADPAEDAHLPGAEEEGIEVGDLFERFNVLHGETGNRVEVVRLYGPGEATRTAVLRHLMMRTYDVLHFAGHCVYDKDDPAASGWIFSNGERLSASEITRIDRSPSLVFSNACESGITPARCDERAADLAPSFAESFFARGVTNFVCTAWPVDDRAARIFALTLYANLLGLEPVDKTGHLSGMSEFNPVLPEPMFVAMQNARLKIFDPMNDARTWGAYQHYGNPYFRLFDPTAMSRASYGVGENAIETVVSAQGSKRIPKNAK